MVKIETYGAKEPDLEEEAKEILKPIPSKCLELLNNSQLWSIYNALYYHTELVEPLKSATARFARRIYKIGKRKYNWV